MESKAEARDMPYIQVRILIVEDSMEDAELMERELRASDINGIFQRVDERSPFESALREFNPDVILCDYELPGIGGYEGLQMVRTLCPQVPFIFVSDTRGEEVAIEALKLGATDYVLKANLRRLGPSVKRALRESAEHGARFAIEQKRDPLEPRWKTILDNAVFGIYQTTPSGRILLSNSTLARILGYDSPDELQASVTNIGTQVYANPQDRERILHMLDSQGSVSGVELQLRRKDGAPVWVSLYARAVRDSSGRVAFYEGFLEDMTHRKQLEAVIQQSQKMEILGELAGGIAHDFNNMLQGIIGMAELAAEKLASDHPVRADLNRLLEAALRAADLTRKILTFARREHGQAQPLEIRGAVSDLLEILRRTLGSSVQIREEQAEEPLTVIIDPAHFDQMIINLATNAKQAMLAGGTLKVSSRCREVGQEMCAPYPWVKPGTFAEITVSDTGVGMDTDTLSRIFEPYFTTKPDGTGLGLSVVYGIVKAAGGFVSVESQPGKGSTFRVLLPLAPEHIQSASAVPLVRDDLGWATTTVLIADDDDMVRGALEAGLRNAGFITATASNGEEVLHRLQTADPPIGLIILDVMMPKMTLEELLDRIHKLTTVPKVILMSGHSHECGDLPRILRAYTLPLIQKPFRVSRIVEMARAVLAENPSRR